MDLAINKFFAERARQNLAVNDGWKRYLDYRHVPDTDFDRLRQELDRSVWEAWNAALRQNLR